MPLTNQRKKATYFGSEFVSAVGQCLGSLYLSWCLGSLCQNCLGLDKTLEPLTHSINVMTDCKKLSQLGFSSSNFCNQIVVFLQSKVVGLKAQSGHCRFSSKPSTRRNLSITCFLAAIGKMMMTCSFKSDFGLRCSCDNARGPRAFIKSNFPKVQWGSQTIFFE